MIRKLFQWVSRTVTQINSYSWFKRYVLPLKCFQVYISCILIRSAVLSQLHTALFPQDEASTTMFYCRKCVQGEVFGPTWRGHHHLCLQHGLWRATDGILLWVSLNISQCWRNPLWLSMTFFSFSHQLILCNSQWNYSLFRGLPKVSEYTGFYFRGEEMDIKACYAMGNLQVPRVSRLSPLTVMQRVRVGIR